MQGPVILFEVNESTDQATLVEAVIAAVMALADDARLEEATARNGEAAGVGLAGFEPTTS